MKQCDTGMEALGPGQEADQVFVELQLVSRRLQRIERLLGTLTTHDTPAQPWPAVREHCSHALAHVALAAQAVPDALPEHDHEPRSLVVRDLRLDSSARRAWFADHELLLPGLEFELLGTLAADPLRVHSKTELLRTVWGHRTQVRTRTVESHASRLRRRLVAAGACSTEWMVNQWGVGYALLRPLPATSTHPRGVVS